MTITNGYATLIGIKAELGITDATSDTRLEAAVSAASRQIDWHTGQSHGFWQDPTVVAQTYYADDARTVTIPDGISTLTGLIVKIDINDDGNFAQTLAISTNYILKPVNALLSYPVQPYTEIHLIDYTGSFFPRWWSGRPGVQVTAKFGWPAIPDDVNKACLIQATQLYKATDAVFGVLGGFDGAGVRVGRGLNPIAESLLEGYCLPRVA